MNSCANVSNSCANVTNSCAKLTTSIAKLTNSTANGTKSIAKVTNSIAKTCTDLFNCKCDPLSNNPFSQTSFFGVCYLKGKTNRMLKFQPCMKSICTVTIYGSKFQVFI